MIIEHFQTEVNLENQKIFFKDDYVLIENYALKKLKHNNLTIINKENLLIVDYTLKTKTLANTWVSILRSLVEGLKEPYAITLKKVFRKKFEFYHELLANEKKLKITLFEKQRKPIILDFSSEYFNSVNIEIRDNEITFSSYSKEILGNAVGKLIGIRKGKLLRKDLRKFITGYVRV